MALGSAIALPGRAALLREGLLRSSALWSLVALYLLVSYPVGFFLLTQYPDWSVMYLVEGSALPMHPGLLAALGPTLGVGSFVLVRGFIRKEKAKIALGIVVGLAALVVALVVFGYDQITHVGTTAAFRSGLKSKGLVALSESPLSFLAGGGLLALLSAWGYTSWRIILLGKATALRLEQMEALEARGDTQAKVAPRRQTRRRRRTTASRAR